MHRTWFVAGRRFVLWAAWSIASGIAADAAAVAQSSSGATGVLFDAPAATSTATPQRPAAVASPMARDMIEADKPIAHRLPIVSSFAPTPVSVPLSEYEVILPPPPIGIHASPPAGEASGKAASRGGPIETNTLDSQLYTPTIAELTSQLLPAVRRGYALAQRGALYAAQTEFVQVLRRVAQAKDAAHSGEEHSRALAAGLRALDEAEDFAPRGLQLEGDVNVWAVASSHRTPLLQQQANDVSLHQAASLYHAFAERQLAYAAGGEQVGSMALHGLGKINARLAELSDHDVQHLRKATVMFSAALAARPDNHLAANELGVLLCRNGRPAEAARLFERTIDVAPSATAYHNLAVAQRKLGMHGRAVANEQESQRLAAWERTIGAVSRRAGVAWVAPADMARVAQPGPLTPKPVVTEAPRKSPWQKTADLAKSLPLPGINRPKAEPQYSVERHAALPFLGPTMPSQSQIR
jgi:tetratricopeptide (TPR) repeat protein